MRCEPFIAAVRSERFWIIRDNFLAEDFSKLRNEFHYEQSRAGQFQGKAPRPGGPASPEDVKIASGPMSGGKAAVPTQRVEDNASTYVAAR